MDYYSVPNQGNIFLNFIVVHPNITLAGLVSLFAITGGLLLLWVYRKGPSTLPGVMLELLACLGLAGSAMSYSKIASDGTYYTSSDDVSSWTDNTVYLVGPGTTKGNKNKNAPLITRTATKINADSPSGAAYLCVTRYLINHRKEISNVNIYASLEKTVAIFDTPNGSKKIASYANKKAETEDIKNGKKLREAFIDKGFSRMQLDEIESNIGFKAKVLYWRK